MRHLIVRLYLPLLLLTACGAAPDPDDPPDVGLPDIPNVNLDHLDELFYECVIETRCPQTPTEVVPDRTEEVCAITDQLAEQKVEDAITCKSDCLCDISCASTFEDCD